jgi:hypothetical protein
MATGILGMPSGILSQQQGTQLMGASNDQARQQALSAGAIAAGAGLLGAPNLREGLAQGLTGFNRGFNTELLANRPKVTSLAGGAFSQITFPDGRVEVMSNDDVQKFLQEQTETNVLGKMQLARFNAGIATDKLQKQADLKTSEEATPLLRSTNELIGKYDNVLNIVKAQSDPNNPQNFYEIPGIGRVNKAQAQALAPGLAGFFGGDQVAANKFLQELKVAETLANTALTKGAISNAEMALFMSPIPALTDSREEVWEPWLKARMPVLEKIQKFYAQQASKGQEGQATTGGASAFPVSPPANTNVQAAPAGAGAVFNSPDDVRAAIQAGTLKSGDTFKTPDGQIRTVK